MLCAIDINILIWAWTYRSLVVSLTDQNYIWFSYEKNSRALPARWVPPNANIDIYMEREEINFTTNYISRVSFCSSADNICYSKNNLFVDSVVLIYFCLTLSISLFNKDSKQFFGISNDNLTFTDNFYHVFSDGFKILYKVGSDFLLSYLIFLNTHGHIPLSAVQLSFKPLG